ncbi:MAG: hypothetical protein QOG34_2216, partial [Frankiaceae bacterium]|nr:hypothetical protein [Frankiaceae bacterium]
MITELAAAFGYDRPVRHLVTGAGAAAGSPSWLSAPVAGDFATASPASA